MRSSSGHSADPTSLSTSFSRIVTPSTVATGRPGTRCAESDPGSKTVSVSADPTRTRAGRHEGHGVKRSEIAHLSCWLRAHTAICRSADELDDRDAENNLRGSVKARAVCGAAAHCQVAGRDRRNVDNATAHACRRAHSERPVYASTCWRTVA